MPSPSFARTIHCMTRLPDGSLHLEHPSNPRWIDEVPGTGNKSVRAALGALRESDLDAWASLCARINQAAQGRISRRDFDRGRIRAALGADGRSGADEPGTHWPWLAELKVTGTTNPTRWHRLYFGDIADQPGEPRCRMVATGLHAKLEEDPSSVQTTSINTAADTLQRWCGTTGGTDYRRWHEYDGPKWH